MKELTLGTYWPLKIPVDNTGHSKRKRTEFMKWEGKSFNTIESKAKELIVLNYFVFSWSLARTAPSMEKEDNPCGQIKGSRPGGGARNPNQSKQKSQGQVVSSWCSEAKQMGH